VLGLPGCFFGYFSDSVETLNSGSGNGAVVFQIGRMLNGNVDVEKEEKFGKNHCLIGPANSAISFYESQLTSCGRAVDAWSHVGIRCGVVKDIRVLIGKLVWESRDLALYKFD
jgi:hypothetical protein